MTLLEQAAKLIHTARWAAGKLDIEMNKRYTISPRAEFEALVNLRADMADWLERYHMEKK